MGKKILDFFNFRTSYFKLHMLRGLDNTHVIHVKQPNFNRTKSKMSLKKQTTYAIDYPSEFFYYVPEIVALSGPLAVNDANSPGGKRTTKLFNVIVIDMKGQRVAVEVWGAKKVLQSRGVLQVSSFKS